MAQEASYDALMREVCVGLGWCGGIVNGVPLHVDDFIPEDGLVTVNQFVDWLLQADGMDPDAEPEKWRTSKDDLRAAFIRHMGSDVADARDLK